jgi:heterodisulfide reductase subunit A
VAEEIEKMPGVAYAVSYKYMCSEPGQQMVKDAIVNKTLTDSYFIMLTRLHDLLLEKCLRTR